MSTLWPGQVSSSQVLAVAYPTQAGLALGSPKAALGPPWQSLSLVPFDQETKLCPKPCRTQCVEHNLSFWGGPAHMMTGYTLQLWPIVNYYSKGWREQKFQILRAIHRIKEGYNHLNSEFLLYFSTWWEFPQTPYAVAFIFSWGKMPFFLVCGTMNGQISLWSKNREGENWKKSWRDKNCQVGKILSNC